MVGSSIRRGFALAHELKRRHVVRVAVAYVAAAWIAIQGASTIVPALHLPDALTTIIVVLAVLGFPVALVLAWAYDITPEGVRRTPDDPASQEATTSAPAPSPEASRDPGGAALGAAGITSTQLEPPFDVISLQAAAPAAGAARGAHGTRPGAPHSIAALPFVDLSPSAGADRFWGDGITEELTSALARVDGLRVVSRTSAFALREQTLDVREIGRRLGAGLLVEGSVRVIDERLRLTASLVDARDGLSLWSAQFDRRTEDIFTVQEEVARAIVEHVRGSLPGPGRALAPPATRDVAAYTLYLSGRHFWSQRTPEALRTASDRFAAAIQADPRMAAAHAGLADCLGILMEYGLVGPAESLERARAAARRAVELSPGSAEARSALGLVHQIGWEWAEAEAALAAALELDPSHGGARQRYALLLAWGGRAEEAERQIAAAQEIDPLAPAIRASAGWIAYYARRFDRALVAQGEVLQAHPDFASARLGRSLALLATGRADDAVDELERAVARDPAGTPARALLALALARRGTRAAAREALATLLQLPATTHVSPFYLAVARLGAEGAEAALATLEQAADQRAPQLVYLAVEPLFDELRREQRFQALLARIGLGGSALGAHSTSPSSWS